MEHSLRELAKNYEVHLMLWKKLYKRPPSGVRVISWSRNCPNCIAMWVKPFVLSLVSPWVLCIALDTSRGLTSTWTTAIRDLIDLPSSVNLSATDIRTVPSSQYQSSYLDLTVWLINGGGTENLFYQNLTRHVKIWVVRLPISRGGQTPHSDGSRSPVLRLLVLQVVALPIDPTDCVIFPAVHTLSFADIVRCPRQLRNRDVWTFPKEYLSTFPKNIDQLTSSKAPLSGGIPSFTMDLRTEFWRARRSRLWIATMFVRLLTVTNGIVKLASCDLCSRLMNSSMATSRSFRMVSRCESVTGSPIEFFTASRLTSFPRSSADGKSPGQNLSSTS